ncbi:MAG: class I SAM-dependent methyltransferase [Candidatus Parabeggiatoa sp.]|nr:class I SAM-dependent methyltransferase [Candidatus Parabeggiatoa sp.]
MTINTEKWLKNISKHPKDVEKEYDSISHSYDAELEAKGYMAPQQAGTIIKNHLPNTETLILEAGCGTGLLGLELNKQGFSNLTGMDISSNCLKEAESKNVYAKTVKHNLLEPFPFPDKTFDGVVCVGVFSRFDEAQIKQIVAEFARVTKDEGTILFSHRDDLITPLTYKTLDELEAVKVEKVTETLPYFSIDEHYKDIKIRFFILRKG